MPHATRIAHLEMIQRAIDRMSHESASIKTFALASTAAVVSIAGATSSSFVGFAGIFLLIIFWCMDAQYLAQERGFREMYSEALVTTPVNFVMTPSAAIRAKNTLLHTLWGWSTAPLYGALVILCLGLALWIVIR